MRFSPWRRRRARNAVGFKPEVDVLEDRIVPTAFRQMLPPLLPVPGPVTHFQVVAPATVQAGHAFNVVIEAEDANNRIVTGYKGTVHLTLGKADLGASLPANFIFSAADHGAHLVSVTLAVAGSQTIAVKDTTGKLNGSAAVSVTLPPTHFVVISPTTVTAGFATTATVEALDAKNQVVAGYAGTVHLSSSDSNAILPTDYTFQPSDGGVHQFSLIFNTVGQQTLTASDGTLGLNGANSVKVFSAYSPYSSWGGYGYGYGYGYGGYLNVYGGMGRSWWY